MHFLALFHAARTRSGSLRSPPSPRGEGFIRRYSFSTDACIRSDVMGEAVFSYRSLPHWGRGTAPAVDRVLSYNACLRRIFHLFQLSFIPLEPYPARYARPLPLEGKADDARETCCQEIFGHRPIYICGEAATTTLNPQPRTLNPAPKKNPCQAKPLDKSIFLLYNNIRCGDELCLLKTS